MSDINIITPPDKLYNNSYDMLLLCLSSELKDQALVYIAESNKPMNVYLYENCNHTYTNVEWLLSLIKGMDVVIFDLDNSDSYTNELASYIIAHTNVYWLTNSDNVLLSLLSRNRVYDLHFLKGNANEL